jgi:hypothetical protein
MRSTAPTEKWCRLETVTLGGARIMTRIGTLSTVYNGDGTMATGRTTTITTTATMATIATVALGVLPTAHGETIVQNGCPTIKIGTITIKILVARGAVG